jgi:uncharacterized protein
MDALEHSADDRRVVEAQLGRPVRGRWRVARRCHLGVAMVIENYPRLQDGTPFPTTFWLTCPVLARRAGTLESVGWMNDLTDELHERGALRSRLFDAVDRYKERRDAHERIAVSSPPGGGPDRVKCLHAHVAHELADPPNPIGGRVLARSGWPDCLKPCVG